MRTYAQPSAAMLAAYQADPALASMRLDFTTTLREVRPDVAQDPHAASAGRRTRTGSARQACRSLVSLRSVAGHATPATTLLDKQGIAHTVHTYQHDPRHACYGTEASEALRIPPERVFKTLITEVDGALTVAVLPVATNLDLKALAAAAGGKRAAMAAVMAAERATGYVAGGISPLGQRKPLPVIIDASALAYATIYCSGGRRGLEIELAPGDLVRAANAAVAPISQPPQR